MWIIVDTFRISNDCLMISLNVVSNNVLRSSKLVFLNVTKFSWWWSPRWTEDRIVVDISNHQMQFLSQTMEHFLNLPIVWDLHSVVRQPGPVKLTCSTSLQFSQLPELSHTSPRGSFPQLPWPTMSSFLPREHFPGFWFLFRCSFQQLPDTDSESTCGFTRTSEAFEPKDEGCFRPYKTGGRLALGPFRFPKLGMGHLSAHLFGRNGPLEVRGIEISTRDRRGTLISIPFLGLSLPFWRSKKTSKCEHSKNPYKSRSRSTKNTCCLIHIVSRICFSPKQKCTSQICICFSRCWAPHFCTVFSTICGTVVKENEETQGGRN